MADFVEQLSDVELQNPIDMPAPLSRRSHGVQGRLPRPVAIGVRQEDGFHVRLEGHFDDRLRHAICYRGHTQNAFSAILLRNGDRFHRRWEVRPRRHPVPEFVQVVLQVRFEVGNRLLVYTTTARIGLDGLEGFIHQRLWNVERLCCTHSLPPVSSCFYKCSPLTQPLRSEPHYRAFIATTGRSSQRVASVHSPRGFMPLVLLPFASTLWFPRFRRRPHVSVTPAPRRSPPGLC